MIDADLIYVGIDVSKASLDICVGVMGSMSTLGNDGAGHDALCRMLKPLKVGLVVLEGRGGFGWLRVCVRGRLAVGGLARGHRQPQACT